MNGVFVIAEAGVNHNGDMGIARQLIDAASQAGADAVKFQTFQAEKIVCKTAAKAGYQAEVTGQAETQLEMLRKLELTPKMHRDLMEYCNQKKIMFLSTPFDLESVRLLARMDMPVFKAPSGEITNLPYLREVAKQKKQVMLSTGMSSMEEVKAAVKILRDNGTENIILLHCNSQYPTPMKDVNLLAMVEMGKETGLPVGYSDHTRGLEAPLAAVALGACVIEKHFTLSRHMEGPDHKASLEPNELKQMVEGIRKVGIALGDGVKRVSDSERENVSAARKSIVAACKIQAGDIFTDKNIIAKRPGNGISPMLWDDLIGRMAKHVYFPDDMICAEELER